MWGVQFYIRLALSKFLNEIKFTFKRKFYFSQLFKNIYPLDELHSNVLIINDVQYNLLLKFDYVKISIFLSYDEWVLLTTIIRNWIIEQFLHFVKISNNPLLTYFYIPTKDFQPAVRHARYVYLKFTYLVGQLNT